LVEEIDIAIILTYYECRVGCPVFKAEQTGKKASHRERREDDPER